MRIAWSGSWKQWLAVAWFANLFFSEFLVYTVVLGRCSWPTHPSWSNKEKVHHVAVIADPQLTDAFSYDYPALLLRFLERHNDAFQTRSYRALRRRLQPEHVVFVGDLFDGAILWTSDSPWYEELDRFKHVFSIDSLPARDMTFVVGNHDIGFGDRVLLDRRARFEAVFGKTNNERRIAGHELIALDTVSLSARMEGISHEAKSYLDAMGQSYNASVPRILLTHVPLYRPVGASCGPLRNFQSMPHAKGYQFQSHVAPGLTRDILDKIKPVLVFSGDDHFQCQYRHPDANALEYTVGSFSWLMSNVYPSFGMLSLRDCEQQDCSVNGVSFSFSICFLPAPWIIIGWYIATLIASGLWIVWKTYAMESKAADPLFHGLITPRSTGSWATQALKTMSQLLALELGVYIAMLYWTLLS